jgi:hypothetical protein
MNVFYYCFIVMLLCVIVVAIIVYAFFIIRDDREGFTSEVLGRLAPYKVGYFEALADCEREDPAKIGAKTKGNVLCSDLSNTRYNHLVKENGQPPVSSDSLALAQRYCGEDRDCVGNYFAQMEIAKKCVQDCAYAKLAPEECKKQCFFFYAPNATSGMGPWTWK